MATGNELRARTVGEILDASFALYRRRFGTLLLVSTVMSLPTLVAAVVFAAPNARATGDYVSVVAEVFQDALHERVKTGDEAREFMERMNGAAVSVQLYALLGALFQALSRGAVCVAAAILTWDVLHGRPAPSAREILRRAIPRAAAGVGAQLVIAVILLMCSLCLPIPILVAAFLAPAAAVAAIERGPLELSVRALRLPGPLVVVRWFLLAVAETFDAVTRSFSLGWHGLSVARSTFLVFVILTIVSFVTSFVSVTAAALTRSFGVLWVLQHYVEVVLLPVVGIAFALWYADLCVRREALDLLPEAESPAPGAGPAPAAA